MLTDDECRPDEPFADKFKNQRGAGQMKGRFRQDSLASQQRLSNSLGNLERPSVIMVSSIAESHEETGVGNSPHVKEKPFRFDSPEVPSTAPARRMKERLLELLAFSSSSRTMRPCGTPVFRAVARSHSARSSGRRTEIVLR